MEKISHITGLRAYAVLAVLLFHLDVTGLTGGYVGVDVFFVISGYLITGILVKEVERTGRIDFLRFYTRRVRRLFPALIVTLAATFLASAAILSADHMQRLGSSTIYAALSVSNILFWRETGYFDVLQEFKPLLHTWSLSVEMQFYLFWPVAVLCACRWSPARAPIFLAGMGLLSFGVNYMFAGEALFFLTPFRVFEFAIGGLLVWVPRLETRSWRGSALLLLGMALMLAPVFVYVGSLDFPRHAALVPCVGAAMVILYGSSPAGEFFLSNRTAVGLGQISYSLYLVHWPLIVLYRYWHLSDGLSTFEQFALALSALGLALLLYWLVERPFRYMGSHKPAFIWAATAATVVALSIPAASAAVDGWGWRNEGVFPAELIAQERELWDSAADFCRIESDLVGDCDFSKSQTILVVGDSHLPAVAYALRETMPDVQIVSLSYWGCSDRWLVSEGRVESTTDDPSCAARAAYINDRADELLQDVDGIVLASYRPFSYSINLFRFDLMDLLLSRSPPAKGFILGDYFQTSPEKPCNVIVQRRGDINSCLDPEFATYVGDLETVKREPYFSTQGSKYHFIDIARLSCPTLIDCPASFNGVPALSDSDHLYFSFAKFLFERILDREREHLTEAGFLSPILNPLGIP